MHLEHGERAKGRKPFAHTGCGQRQRPDMVRGNLAHRVKDSGESIPPHALTLLTGNRYVLLMGSAILPLPWSCRIRF